MKCRWILLIVILVVLSAGVYFLTRSGEGGERASTIIPPAPDGLPGLGIYLPLVFPEVIPSAPDGPPGFGIYLPIITAVGMER